MSIRSAQSESLTADLARLEDLLAERVTGGESGMADADVAELRRLSEAHPAEAADLEASLLDTLLSVPPGPLSPGRKVAASVAGGAALMMPATLKASILRDASLVLGSSAGSGAGAAAMEAAKQTTTASTATPAATSASTAGSGSSVIFGSLTWRAAAVIGWASAAAALLAVATLAVVVLQQPEIDTPPIIIDEQLQFAGSDMPLALSYHVVKDRDAIRVGLYPPASESRRAVGEQPAAGEPARGLAIWSDRRQAGLLQIEDLPVNDPTVEQYQVWVIDLERPAGLDRVNGGVFNVTPDRAIQTLAVQPNLPVGRAGGFVITLEPAGGSLASYDDSRLVVSGTIGRND